MDNEQVVESETETPSVSSEANPSSSVKQDLSTELSTLNQQTIREQQETIARLQTELAQKNATPVKEQDDTTSFLNAPRQAIRDEVASQVKPLQDFVSEMRRDREYDRLVDRLKTQAPALYAGYLENQTYVDQIMSTQEATPQNLVGAITMAKGAVAFGLAGNPNPTPPKATTTLTPPNIPPSAPPAPKRGEAGKDRIDQLVEAMTESQRKAARLQGFTNMREYIEFTEADGDIDSLKGIKK